jgi:hypothetical protein
LAALNPADTQLRAELLDLENRQAREISAAPRLPMVRRDRRAAPECHPWLAIELEAPATLSLNCEVDAE